MNPENNNEKNLYTKALINIFRNYKKTLREISIITFSYILVIVVLFLIFLLPFGGYIFIALTILLFIISILLPFYKYKPPNSTYSGKHTLNLILKRILDLLIVLPASLMLFPLMFLVSIFVKLDSAGPVIYRRKVIGLYGYEIEIFKFRTLYFISNDNSPRSINEKTNQNTLSGITRAGRFLRQTSIDELPQLLNVLWGEMSLVGPRAVSIEEMENMGNENLRRFSFPPGLTGHWQISYITDPSYKEMLEFDLTYVDNWSLLNDIKIIFYTIPSVMTHKI